MQWVRSLGNAGAVANAEAVLERRREDERAVNALVSRVAPAQAPPAVRAA